MKQFTLFLCDYIAIHNVVYELPAVQNYLYLNENSNVAFADALSAILYEFANDPGYEMTPEAATAYLRATRASVNGLQNYTIYYN